MLAPPTCRPHPIGRAFPSGGLPNQRGVPRACSTHRVSCPIGRALPAIPAPALRAGFRGSLTCGGRTTPCGACRLSASVPGPRCLPPDRAAARALTVSGFAYGCGSAKERGRGGGRPASEAAPGGGREARLGPSGRPGPGGGARGYAVWGQENLALEMSLSAEQVYNWFANYRRRRRALLQRRPPTPEDAAVDLRVRETAPEPQQPPGQPRLGPGGAARPQWPGERVPRPTLCPARFSRARLSERHSVTGAGPPRPVCPLRTFSCVSETPEAGGRGGLAMLVSEAAAAVLHVEVTVSGAGSPRADLKRASQHGGGFPGL